MENKRYSIVRVDEDCPKEIDSKFVCNIKRDKYDIGTCYCRYGDTKEQMIKKVAQILFKNAPKETYQPRYIEQKRKILEFAKEIVEFLGVK